MEPAKGLPRALSRLTSVLRVTGFWFGVLSPAWYTLRVRWTPKGLPRMLPRLTLALLISGPVPLGSFGRWAAQSAPTPRTSSVLATRLVRTGSEVGPARGRLVRYHASFLCCGYRVTGVCIAPGPEFFSLRCLYLCLRFFRCLCVPELVLSLSPRPTERKPELFPRSPTGSPAFPSRGGSKLLSLGSLPFLRV